MESDRIDHIDHIVSTLRARGIMAHRVDEGVYEFGIRVVIPDGSEALWTLDAGLDAEVLHDGTLVGFVPHVPGSETFSDEQTIDAIAAARYSEEGLHPASRTVPRSVPEAGPGQPPEEPLPADTGPRHAPWHPHRLRWPHR
ncbi:hypothetical protein [Actinacidiphila acidipaludis]|uniref:Uncharacterized protein n=1 Tax=Actinacidiphila acidipaludis TaxID=2873382 RepID=A0ABS7QH91_9ACTN|nr:hypothetical protein [Streptomyces acidipaludis]MBY8881297.1 hypothetical protein [Streptomyces acidipaludis]